MIRIGDLSGMDMEDLYWLFEGDLEDAEEGRRSGLRYQSNREKTHGASI